MKKLTITIVTLFAAMSMQLSAQEIKHEFSVHVGGGLSSLSYKLSEGDRSGGFGGDFGVGYTFLQVKERAVETGRVSYLNWGIHSGIGLGLYNAKANLDNTKTVIKDLDDGDDYFSAFDLRTTLSDYNETQKTMFLNIPVMGLFQLDKFYAMGGVKIGIPLNGKYSVKNPTLTNKAWYPELQNEIDAPRFRGLGKFDDKSFDGTLDLGVAVMLSLEAGYKWSIADNISLYTGAYFDYGLNNVDKSNKKTFVNYTIEKNNTADFTTNSVLASYSDSKNKSTTFTDKVNVMAVGIKVRVAMAK